MFSCQKREVTQFTRSLSHLLRFKLGAYTLVLLLGCMTQTHAGLLPLGDELGPSRASEKPSPFLTPKEIPARPSLMLELGDPFLDTGKLYEGFYVPVIGAVWQPRLWVYSTTRTALQSFDNGNGHVLEWNNRIDVYANLQLTGTEKINWGIRPLDKNRPGQFTGYNFTDGRDDDWFTNFNSITRTLFFEGDLASLIPNLDRKGDGWWDFGFTVGRQVFNFQEGIMINDNLDAVGIVRNNLHPFGIPNFRISALYAWGDLDRNSFALRGDSDPELYGLFLSADTGWNTINMDMIYVDDNIAIGDAYYAGIASIQRMGHVSTAFRVNTSQSIDVESPGVGDGVIVSVELSKNVVRSDDIVYFNLYNAFGNFVQAGREPISGGPLGSLGILFASPNLGNYGAELNPLANRVGGVATGYQAFWNHHRTNLILEYAMRIDNSDTDFNDYAVGAQLQQAIGRRLQLQFESYFALRENRDNTTGARAELLLQW
jgi:hypothetical protein